MNIYYKLELIVRNNLLITRQNTIRYSVYFKPNNWKLRCIYEWSRIQNMKCDRSLLIRD